MSGVESQSSTVTFVFTDIEGSTKLLRTLGDDYASMLERHDAIIGEAASAHGGQVFGSEGDAQFLVFDAAVEAVRAAAAAQRSLAAERWPGDRPLRVRMGIHTGAVRPSGDSYVGLALHETARVAAAGHGGQVLLSGSTLALVRESLPESLVIRDLGEHRLKDFDHPIAIGQLLIAGLDDTFPPLRTEGPVGARLPAQMTSWVGRDEVEIVARLAQSSRLVTLTGPGGTGKTRLSIEVATEIAGRFEAGTFFVALDAVRDPHVVASEITATIGLPAGADPPLERLIAYLRDLDTLLVLDNMEQITEARDTVSRLLRECPRVSIIVTSRVPLKLYGEVEFAVPALSVPALGEVATVESAAGYEAVKLFVARARAARPDFVLDSTNSAAVVDIVKRLDGLPLAIELAAARLRMLPVEALYRRLDDRLSTLVGGARDLPSRQRTLRGAIEWSHDLLDEQERRFFARFSVIAGSAALEQIEAIGAPTDEADGDVFASLESLHEQSLIRSIEWGAEARFGMLATIRDYAAERLAESDEDEAIHRRHAEAFLAVAEQVEPQLVGPDAAMWNDRLEAEHDNLRAALDWIVANDEGTLGLRMISALWRFWQVRGHLQEGAARIDQVLAMPSEAQQSADLRSRAEIAAGSVAYWSSRIPLMHGHYTRALDLARAADDKGLLALAVYSKGFAPNETEFSQVGRYRDGQPFFQEALDLYRELGDRAGEASALWALSQSAMARSDDEASDRMGWEALVIGRELGDPFRIGWSAFTLGLDRLSSGNDADVAALLSEALEIFADSGDAGGVTLTLTAVAALAQIRGDEEVSWQLLGASTRSRDDSGTNLLDEDVTFGAWDPQRRPETAASERAYEAGREMGTDAGLDLARNVIVDAAGGVPRRSAGRLDRTAER